MDGTWKRYYLNGLLQDDISGLGLVSGPYYIVVDKPSNYLIIYAKDENGTYNIPVKAMLVSCGYGTPTGVYYTPYRYRWLEMVGNTWAQWCTQIQGNYLFHSVPNWTYNNLDLEVEEFNHLGETRSLGCIRLCCEDAKWIYDNCPIGTTVVIYDDAATPGPMGTPGTIYIDPDDETYRGWDPTDPDAANPWDEHYRTGTTIRSEAAWAEWDAAQDDGRWHNTINPADLQGYSTDYKTEGTRG